MIILGLDLATRSGFAVRDSEKHRSSTICGTFSVAKNNAGDKLEWEDKYPVAANLFERLLKEYKPDFVAIERPEHGVRQFTKKRKGEDGEEESIGTINPSALQLTGIFGAIAGICNSKAVPFGYVASQRWRALYFKGLPKPQGKWDQKDADGQKLPKPAGWFEDWKDLAIHVAKVEHIELPSTIAEQRDAAEAIGVCAAWTACDIPKLKWMRDKFVELRTGALDAKRKQERQLSLV